MNKVEIKKFLEIADVRVINNEYIVLKDMFDVLGRVKADGTWTNEKKKMLDFLEGIGKSTDHQTLVVTSKEKKHSRELQNVECLKLETVPVVLTQFKPTARKGKENLEKWFEFMKFVNELLIQAKAHEFILEDKELEKIDRDRISKYGGSPMIMATMTSTAMGVIITGEKVKIKKDDLKSYQNQTTIDLLECRRYFIDEFIRAYRITKSHKESNRLALEFTLEQYNLIENKIVA